MRIRAIIVDIYKTVMEVRPPPPDAEERWQRLWRDVCAPGPARLSLSLFGTACKHVVEREHVLAHSRGIAFPEVFWPDVVREVVPELNGKSNAVCDEFMFRQASLWHTVCLAPGAADVLRFAASTGCLLGIASNAQPYTLKELETVFSREGLTLGLFSPDLCFWSFENGFSKPDPHVFRILGSRLRGRMIASGETLMVGDREDNDIAPAAAEGWQTWQIRDREALSGTKGGDWFALKTWLDSQNATDGKQGTGHHSMGSCIQETS
jgi:FMN phosphatase YigB (HAD superfamily)